MDNERPITKRHLYNTPARRSKKRGTTCNAAAKLVYLCEAEASLKHALWCAKQADAPMFAGKVRAALKSVGGAIRHAALAPYREARQAKAKDMKAYIAARVEEESHDHERVVDASGEVARG